MPYEKLTPIGVLEKYLTAGLPTIQTLTWGAKSTYANNQTIIDSASGIVYELEVNSGTFTPAGGAVVAIDISGATTSAQVEAIGTPAMVAQAGSHWTATVGGAGTSTFTAKAVGPANNVAFTGTAATTATLTQLGSDPLADPAYPNANVALVTPGSVLTGDGVKPVVVTLAQLLALAPQSATVFGTLGSASNTVSAKAVLGIASLACDTKGGFEFGAAGHFGVDPGAITMIGINGTATDAVVSGVLLHSTTITNGVPSFAAGLTAHAANGSGGIGMQAAGQPTRGWFRYRIACRDPWSTLPGHRRFEVDWTYEFDTGASSIRQTKFDIAYKGLDEITDVALYSSVAGTWPANTQWWFRRLP